MKLFAKIFLYATILISAAILFSGYLLITFSAQNALERETAWALNQYQYDKFTVQSWLISYGSAADGEMTADRLASLSTELGNPAALFDENRNLLFSNTPTQLDLSFVDGVTDEVIVHGIQSSESGDFLLIAGKVRQGGVLLYLLTATDISSVTVQKDLMTGSFGRVYFIALGLSMLLIIAASTFLTRPINRMTRATARIAGGKYDERLPARGSDEIGVLAENFNIMADAVEDKIDELSRSARQKEDFVANFAHELKTPLTSVIGYADMLYQKELSPAEVKSAAWYILSEGLRLEALSLKLMDLIMLDRRDFVLEEIEAEQLIESTVHGLLPLLSEKKVSIRLKAENRLVMAEYDFFKTLLLNLIDNAIKAGSKKIHITGKRESGRYTITVSDDGCGIPDSELERITEAFYMVDKSRSRKQHGAGLGLSLASKIAEIHGDQLRFHSVENAGTVVEFSLALGGDDRRE